MKFKRQWEKVVILATTAVFSASLILPSVASANLKEKTPLKPPIILTIPEIEIELPISLNPESNAEIAKDIEQADALFQKTTTLLPNGTYKFDEVKAKALGLSAAEIAAASSYFKEISSITYASNSKVGEVEEGKAKITLKAIVAALKKNKTKIDNAIKKGIDIIPFVKTATKSKWKKAVTVVALINVIDNFVDASGKVENSVAKGIKKLIPDMPQWAADGIAKTLLFFII